MGDSSEFKYWRFCAWNAPVFMFVFIAFGELMGHNIPPWNPETPAAVVANWFRADANLIRTGMVMGMTFAVCYCVWGLAIARVMGKIVGKDSLLVDLQVWGAGLTVVPLLVSTSFWLAGAYRPAALPDEILQLLYDWAWLLIDLAYSVTTVQLFAAGATFLQDKRQVPLVPQCVALYGTLVGFMFIAESLIPPFTTSAFSRHREP